MENKANKIIDKDFIYNWSINCIRTSKKPTFSSARSFFLAVSFFLAKLVLFTFLVEALAVAVVGLSTAIKLLSHNQLNKKRGSSGEFIKLKFLFC